MSSRRKMSLLEYSELMMMSIRRETSAWNSDTSAPDLKDFSLCPVKAGLEEWRRTARSVSREDLGSLLLRRLLCRSRARGSGEAGAIFEGRTFETGERYSLVGIGRILRVDGCEGGKKGIGQSGFVPVRSAPRKHRRRETATAARRSIAGSRTRNGGAGHEQKPEDEREALGELHGFSVALVRSLYVRARGTGAAASADWGHITCFRPCDWLMPHSRRARFDLVKRGFLDSTFPVRSAPKRVAARTGPFDFIRGRVV